jgi:hypothetical protein
MTKDGKIEVAHATLMKVQAFLTAMGAGPRICSKVEAALDILSKPDSPNEAEARLLSAYQGLQRAGREAIQAHSRIRDMSGPMHRIQLAIDQIELALGCAGPQSDARDCPIHKPGTETETASD